MDELLLKLKDNKPIFYYVIILCVLIYFEWANSKKGDIKNAVVSTDSGRGSVGAGN